MTSCLKSDDEEDDYTITKDSQLTIFALTSKSIPELEKTYFTINQVESTVFNRDSLAFGTDTVLARVKVNYNTGSGLQTFNVRLEEDSIWVSSGDSIDLAYLKQFEIYAPNGDIKKYTFNLNIHQIDPDSIQYTLLKDNEPILASGNNKTILFNNSYLTFVKEFGKILLYQSDDLSIWNPKSLSGLPFNVQFTDMQVVYNGSFLYACSEDGRLFSSKSGQDWQSHSLEYPVISVLGYIKTANSEGVCLIIKKEGVPAFALYTNENNIIHGESVPEKFPIVHFSPISNQESNVTTATVIGTLSTIWSTDNGLYWSHIQNSNQNYPDNKGGSAFIYDGRLYYIDALNEDYTSGNDLYVSKNKGLVWEKIGSKAVFPDSFIKREFASVVVDKEGSYFYIIGGENFSINKPGLTDIWKGAINSMLFEERN